MSQIAIYRKYRPTTFKEIIGQDHVVGILENAVKQKRVGHAYLFHGPRGTGKTSIARVFAAAIGAADIDIHEIDAASNRGIDDVRALRDNVATVPFQSDYKVYIIDEVHMLTPAAFNALLKTIEEPPAHAIFILATTDYEKVPATIVSRTQKFHFRKISLDHIIGKLKAIATEEKYNVTDDALEMIAASAEGSFRDAESLLDQLTSLKDKVDLEAVEKIIGRVGMRRTAELARFIFDNNLQESLTYIETVNDEGHNVVDLTKELIHYIRRVISLAVNPSLEKLLSQQLTDRDLQTLKEDADRVDVSKTIPLLRALIRSYSEMRYAPFITIPLEIALIEHLKAAP